MVKEIKRLFAGELEEVAKNHSVMLTVLVAPLLYFFFIGSIYYFKDIEKVPFAIVDLDNTATSRTISRLLSAEQKIDVKTVWHNPAEAKREFEDMNIEGFVVFPKGFERSLKRLEGADVKLYVNNTRFLPSNTMIESVTKLMLTVGAGVRLRYFVANGMPPEIAMEQVMPVTAELRPLYNPSNNYGNFLLPGLFVLIFHQTLLIGMGESISGKRSRGFPELKNAVGKTGIWGYIAAKSGFYFMLYVAYTLFVFAVLYPFYGLPVNGDIFALSLLSLLFLLSVIFYTLFIASFFKSQIEYMEIMAFSTYPVFLVSGYSWSLDFLPVPLQWVAAALPITPYLQTVRKLALMGGELEHIVSQGLHLLVLTVISAVAVYFRFAYLSKKGN